ncbi:membrane protein, partial [Candidatus Magnetomorum sp. HK-1]
INSFISAFDFNLDMLTNMVTHISYVSCYLVCYVIVCYLLMLLINGITLDLLNLWAYEELILMTTIIGGGFICLPVPMIIYKITYGVWNFLDSIISIIIIIIIFIIKFLRDY